MTSVTPVRSGKGPATTDTPQPTNAPSDPAYSHMGRILKLLPKCGNPELLYIAGRVNQLLNHRQTTESLDQIAAVLGK